MRTVRAICLRTATEEERMRDVRVTHSVQSISAGGDQPGGAAPPGGAPPPGPAGRGRASNSADDTEPSLFVSQLPNTVSAFGGPFGPPAGIVATHVPTSAFDSEPFLSVSMPANVGGVKPPGACASAAPAAAARTNPKAVLFILKPL